jgi:hypothetical protein
MGMGVLRAIGGGLLALTAGLKGQGGARSRAMRGLSPERTASTSSTCFAHFGTGFGAGSLTPIFDPQHAHRASPWKVIQCAGLFPPFASQCRSLPCQLMWGGWGTGSGNLWLTQT